MLANTIPQNIYAVPAGYFDGLASQVLSRIKAMEAANASVELEYLSPMLNNMDKKIPYAVPSGYFEGLAENAMRSVGESSDYQSAAEELETLSPLLGGLKKQMPARTGHSGWPYSVPQGYFENLAEKIVTEENKPAAKVVSFTGRKWFRYAAAAVTIGVVLAIGLVFITKEKVTPETNSYAWIKKNVKKVSTENLEQFIEMADTDESVVSADIKTEEIKELVKDVPQQEIENLLEDASILEDDGVRNTTADETLMN